VFLHFAVLRKSCFENSGVNYRASFLTPGFLELAPTGKAEEHRGEIFLARKIEGAKGEGEITRCENQKRIM